MEKYQPTAEDFKKAEDTMTPMQEELSQMRGIMHKQIENMGVSGHLYASGDTYDYFGEGINAKEGGQIILEGSLNNHDLKIEFIIENNKANYKGTLDGIDLQPKDAERLFRKYAGAARIKDSEEAMIEMAKEEVREQHHLAEALKELL